MLSCRVLGHRYRFRASGEELHWSCQRGCGAGGTKSYPTAAAAQRYAEAFDRDDGAALGRHSPRVALFPLRAWDRLHRRSKDPAGRRDVR